MKVMLEKDEVNHFLLAKGHLLPATRLESTGAVLKELIALDANCLDDAYFSLYLRVRRFDVTAFEKGLYRGRSMARVRGLKNYMQIVPRDYLSAIYSASKAVREAAANSLLGTWGIDDEEYGEVSGRVLESLEGREKTMAQLKRDLSAIARVIRRRREKAENISIVAQAMHARWLILKGGIGRRPGESPGRLSLFRDRFSMELEMDGEEALSMLARRYVKAYGPVCAWDLAWWLGITLKEASSLLEKMEGVESVEIDGAGDAFFIDKRDLPLIKKLEGVPIIFLPKDDPYTKAYYNHARLVQGGRRHMTKFGESASAVLIDGMVWGTWSLRKDAFSNACHITLFKGYPEVRGESIEAAAMEAGRFYTGGSVAVKVIR
jgi:hypothetical protein